ncbi:hypothetical protein EIN_333950 [Entamoeba invadens IP1]|uniref:MD-2-related lipid-recognition domain-containing protein n=1 Tax=Entamoeba invadens IP1 TaxID=370355 RepID=A0A0A1UG81_ENTIV|nr:hypothetical protein EIN_333950 [Entamoeba invadens IP1]ELP92428.1 hypothetical protein EIN_333950 [Entamoeba invadens IP1]|eukprot:XP_004259199.1 hypothetical protein EIN_333950 [Entamoeba invadens IP1]
MFFIALLLAFCSADPGIIDMKFCPDKPVNLDIDIMKVEYQKPAERIRTNYTIYMEVIKPHTDLVLKWHVEYYWGSLYISSYQYDDRDVCIAIEGGCPTKLGPNQMKEIGYIKESVTLPGWYSLVLEMTDNNLYNSCFHGWVYLF